MADFNAVQVDGGFAGAFQGEHHLLVGPVPRFKAAHEPGVALEGVRVGEKIRLPGGVFGAEPGGGGRAGEGHLVGIARGQRGGFVRVQIHLP